MLLLMSILKRVFYVLGGIVALVLVLGLFTGSSFSVETETVINKPLPEVFTYIKQLKNQDNFSKWALMDPNMTKSYNGEDGAVGFVSAWTSENPDVGAGEQEIMAIVENERIDYELRFTEPFASTAKAWMITTATSDSTTKVAWGFGGNMVYPMNVSLLFMNMEGEIGADFATGLGNLKTLLEKAPADSTAAPAPAES
jgi:uncharacterized protein YndB with AHSA1/START domain